MSLDNKKPGKQKATSAPKLSLVRTEDTASPAVTAAPAASISSTSLHPDAPSAFTNVEKFQELVKDIVSFELNATKKTAAGASETVSLTKARVAALESIRRDTPAQVMRLINQDSDDPPKSPGESPLGSSKKK